MIWLLPFTVGSAQKARIADLRSEGWTEIERREEIKNYPGERPYENLTRVIQVIYFVFKKDGMTKICWISYAKVASYVRPHRIHRCP